jgi:hypothetical protein
LLSVAVVSLLGSAAPGFADGRAGGQSDDRGGADRRPDLVGAVNGKPYRVQPGRDGGDAPAQVDATPPPAGAAGTDAGGERRAESPGTVADRSFTALLLLMAAVLVFLAVYGRLDRRDPKLGDRPGDFRRFR